MKNDATSFKTPGQLISSLLEERGWTKNVLATILERNNTIINKIISAKMPVSAELAIDLEEIFNIPAETFLNLQSQYDLATARITSMPKPKRLTRAKIFGDIPVTEMIRRGWLEVEDKKDIDKIESELIRFFNVSSPEQIEQIPHAAKKTDYSSAPSLMQFAWISRVRAIASGMLVAKYRQDSALAAVNKLSLLLKSAEEIRKVPRVLAECGIRFVIVESLKSAKIDGVCFWLNEHSPVIGMSLRHDRIDNFWFVLRHELEHVIQGHGKTLPQIDIELEGKNAGLHSDLPEEEIIANRAAEDFCVNTKKMESFVARKGPFFKETDIVAFANTHDIHPGLVAGQLQYRTGKYHLYRTHLVKVKQIVTPGAAVDGWGDVYPIDD